MPSAFSEKELDQAAPEPIQLDLGTSLALVRRAQQGEEDALGELFERYRDRLQRIVRVELGRELGCFVDADDVLSEVFLVARRRIEDFQPKTRASILAWLVTIAKHKVKDARQKELAPKRDGRRRRPLDGSAVGEGSRAFVRQLASDTAGPETRAFKRELREILDEAMTEIPEDYRRVVLLRDYYGAEWDEIAVELARGQHACEELHRRAWIRLKLDVMRKIRPDGRS